MMNLHVRTRHEGQRSKADNQESRVVEESETAATDRQDTKPVSARAKRQSRSEEKPYYKAKLLIEKGKWKTCQIPLYSADGKVVAHAKIYQAWEQLVAQFTWRVETNDRGEHEAVADICGERVEMSALMMHSCLGRYAPSAN
jgi:hypothetical protein